MSSPVRNAEESKQRILEAAKHIFANKGLDGARVDEIAAKAKINKRMIYHYFESKEGLYMEVFRQYCHKIVDTGERGLHLKGTPVDKVVQIISHYFYFLAENEDFMKLIHWESLHGGRYSRQILPEIAQVALPKLKEVLEDGVEQGLFRKDLDIRHLIISINAICMFYFYRREAYSFLWEEDLMQPKLLEERLHHVLDFALYGILNNNRSSN